MRRMLLYAGSILAIGAAGLIFWTAFRVRSSSMHAGGSDRNQWSPVSAASFLDDREAWWQKWPPAKLGQGTACISCHTVLPYALARPALRRRLGETDLTLTERTMLSSIETRVNQWPRMQPYYTDAAHAASSHSTEAILNAVILAVYSSEPVYNGRKAQPDPIVRFAFDNAWALQQATGENAGAWQWQDFHEAPWESSESGYQGAALMAVAVGMTHTQNSKDPTIRGHVEHLRDYLHRNYPTQPVLNQLYVLWASAEMPGLLSDIQRNELNQKIADLENSDGGWSLASLDRREDWKHTLLDLFKHADRVDGSDGFATGLAVLAMEETGVSSRDTVLQRGLAWLRTHQSQEGSWWAASMNGLRDPASGIGHFMSDAATGYAVMALESAGDQEIGPDSARGVDATAVHRGAALRQLADISKHVFRPI
jgi:squalene-hopene/tetraprenyl-beta-curcumene cyclase